MITDLNVSVVHLVGECAPGFGTPVIKNKKMRNAF